MVGKRIKKLRTARGITQEELGKIVGVTTSMIGMYEIGARNPGYEVLKRIAAFFKVSTDYMLYGFDTTPVGKRIKVPIIGTVTAGPNGFAYEDYQGEEWVEADKVRDGKFFFLKIKGDSMLGEGILPDDLALVRETPEVNYGALAIVIVNDEEGTIKRVYKNDDSIILQASNPSYPPRIFKKKDVESVRIVGEVKMTMRNY